MRLLTLKIDEPLPGQVLPQMIASQGPVEAARRYRSVAVTSLRQLKGLADARIRLLAKPEDAHEAIRFWLLPRLSEKWQATDGVFRSSGWEIDFGGSVEGFTVEASGEILCPYLGCRWVHAALLGLGRTVSKVIGPATNGGEYFSAKSLDDTEPLPERILPALNVIREDADWQQGLDSALGPALKKAWEEEA